MYTVLVLNQSYEPLAIARIQRALSLIGVKAEVLEYSTEPIITSSGLLPRPSVIRLMNMVKRPRPRVRLTRQNIFKRDGRACLFCGKQPKELTIDHVVPASRGGRDSWENLVSACRICNRRKGARTPAEAHMPLRYVPTEPKLSGYVHLSDSRPEWAPFFSV